MEGLSGVRFGEWWTWCQNCGHGGHAHHVRDWFEGGREGGRVVCGVSGCGCRCVVRDMAIYGGEGGGGGGGGGGGVGGGGGRKKRKGK